MIVKASAIEIGNVVARVVNDPGYPGEYIFSGEITGIRRFVAGFVTLDTARGTMSLSDAANVEILKEI